MAHLATIKSRLKHGAFQELPLPKHGSAAVSKLLYIDDLHVLCVTWKGSDRTYAYQEVGIGKARYLKALAAKNHRAGAKGIGSYVNRIKADHPVKEVK